MAEDLRSATACYRDLRGKNALVTGAGKPAGIGFAIARKLAQNGANVALADISREQTDNPLVSDDRQALAQRADELTSAFGVKTMALPVDVTDGASISRMADTLKERFQRVDILCNNAGTVFGVPSGLHTYDDDAWRKTIDVNLNGVFRVSKAIVPLMLANGGSIINSASQAGKKAPLFNGAYAVAKAGVIMLTRVMALELGSSAIRVNAVCPGIIDTDFTTWRFELEAAMLNTTVAAGRRNRCRDIPLGRIGTPAEVADLVVFLASNASRYMTGQALNVTGGMTMD